MNYKTLPYVAVSIVALALVAPASATAPQLTVISANYAFNIYAENWDCDSQSELNGGTCYATPVADYTFATGAHVVQDPISGTFVAVTPGGAGNGSFQPNRGDGQLVSWLHNTAQGNRKTLRETTIVNDALLGCEDPVDGGPCHWVGKDALWGKQSAGLDNLYMFVFVVDTGALPTSVNSWFVYATSADGVTNFTWTEVFKIHRPSGSGSGSMNITNNFRVMQDPSNAARWLGLLAWSFNDGTVSDAGTTPFYLLPNQSKIGILFEDAGWCEFDYGTEFVSFGDNDSCGSEVFPGTGIRSLGDRFYKAPGLSKDVADLSLIDGKALVLKDLWQSTHRCELPNAQGQPFQGYGSEQACAEAHANCGSGLDTALYYERSRDPDLLDRRKPRTWTVREVNYSTWNTSQTALTWNGPAVTIQDGNQGLPFKINPTDNPTIGGYHGGRIVQHNNGVIFLYVPVKHILCEPAESGASAWNRFPISSSGSSNIWLKLSSSQ